MNVRKKEVFSTVYDVSYLAAKQDYSPVYAGAVGGVNNRIGVLGCWGIGVGVGVLVDLKPTSGLYSGS